MAASREQVALVAAGSQSDKGSFLCASVSGEATLCTLCTRCGQILEFCSIWEAVDVRKCLLSPDLPPRVSYTIGSLTGHVFLSFLRKEQGNT